MENSSPPELPRPLHDMFAAVTRRYDLINRLISLGQDMRWRRLAAELCLEGHPQRVLDLGCGTGDLTISLASAADGAPEITGLDYNLPMLEVARQKARRAGLGERLRFVQGEATRLPFPDSFFDSVGLSFAFRNLTYKNPLRPSHLSEMRRVLKPGGRCVIVESSQPGNRMIRTLFHVYMHWLVAPLGTLLSGNKGAYRYLAESVSRFYSPEAVRDMLLTAGFGTVNYRPLFLGVAGIHVASR